LSFFRDERERKIYLLGILYADGKLTDVQLNWRLNELGLPKEEFADTVERIGKRIFWRQFRSAATLLFWLVLIQLLILWFVFME